MHCENFKLLVKLSDYTMGHCGNMLLFIGIVRYHIICWKYAFSNFGKENEYLITYRTGINQSAFSIYICHITNINVVLSVNATNIYDSCYCHRPSL